SVASSAVTIRSHWFALSSTVMSSGFAMAPLFVWRSSGSGWDRSRLVVADAELAHQAEHVGLEPGRDDLAAGDPAERHLAEVDPSSGRLDPEQLAFVRAGLAEAAHDQVAFGDRVLDGHVEVGERGAKRPGHLLAPLGPAWELRRVRGDRVRMEELVGEVVLAVVPDRELAGHDRLVLLDGRLAAALDARLGRHRWRLFPAGHDAELLQELRGAEPLPPGDDPAVGAEQADHDRGRPDRLAGRLDPH